MSRTISIAVRDFALPVPRVGSIEMHSGFGRLPEDGQEIHLRVQQSRAEHFSNYRSEVGVRHEIERDGFLFRLSGRMDGFFEAIAPHEARIEEIKTAFNRDELAKKLERNPDTHPYCLQLKTYGYFHFLKTQRVPELGFHIVSSRNGKAVDVELAFDQDAYQDWFSRRLEEVVAEAKETEARTKRRKRLAKHFLFPFEKPRPGQVELIRTVEEGMKEKKRMLIQAPTGLGKTVGVLYPSLTEALSRGQSVVYVTPKNSQHLVAQDAIDRFRDAGSKVKSLTITAKGKICFKPEPLCNPEFCEYARDHYQKVDENRIPELLAQKRKLTANTFRKLGEEFEVCPFELQVIAAKNADTVICDYNYVFSPRSAMGRLGDSAGGLKGHPNLVIDEAHNLPARGREYYSPALSTVALERMRPSLSVLSDRFRGEVERLIDDGIQTILNCKPEGTAKSAPIDPPLEPFLDQEASLRSFLTRYLESDVEIRPKDPVLRLTYYWSEFTAALSFIAEGREEFFTTYQALPAGGIVKITCCDAAEMLRERYDDFEQVVGFSATLKPFDYYAKLSGLEWETLLTEEFQSPFPKERRKLLLIPQISTKYAQRERSYPRVAEVIERLTSLHAGNYFAFFPSFEFLERVLERFIPPAGFVVMKQEREMRVNQVEAVVEALRRRETPTIVFAVQGGVFSEGVDYPGDTIIGAFVVGPPLPVFDLEREGMREYYQKHYGAGFQYAYTFPAMAKAVQAAGRVIRSETDRGLVVLIDGRFLEAGYAGSMPKDWFTDKPGELVSKSILAEVREFWERTR